MAEARTSSEAAESGTLLETTLSWEKGEESP